MLLDTVFFSVVVFFLEGTFAAAPFFFCVTSFLFDVFFVAAFKDDFFFGDTAAPFFFCVVSFLFDIYFVATFTDDLVFGDTECVLDFGVARLVPLLALRLLPFDADCETPCDFEVPALASALGVVALGAVIIEGDLPDFPWAVLGLRLK